MADDSSPNFDELTAELWQQRTDRPLSAEDGRQIQENVTGFISILQEWNRREQNAI